MCINMFLVFFRASGEAVLGTQRHIHVRFTIFVFFASGGAILGTQRYFIKALYTSTLSTHFTQARYPSTLHKHFIKALYPSTLSKHFIQALYQGISKSMLEISVKVLQRY